MRGSITGLCLLGAAALFAGKAQAASAPHPPLAAPAGSDAQALAVFARKAALAQRLGATDVPVTDELPPALWEMQPKGDPYPAWYIQRPDFLKLFAPPELAQFVDRNYAKRVTDILRARCAVLQRLGLKAQWASNIPQVLPEAFFTAHPQLRGPRVDQPNRARNARFAPSVDQPEILRMYAQSMKSLLAACPQIASFSFLTQDSGSGFDWAPSLYPGRNGSSEFKDRPLSDRVAGFLIALKSAAQESGHDVDISLNPITPRSWMLPTFSPEQLEALLHKLPRGIAVSGREGPDGRPYQALGSSDAYAHGAFYPVVGIAIPDLRWLRDGNPPADGASGRRLISLRPEEAIMEFEARMAEATKASAQAGAAERLTALQAFAASEAGEAHAGDLLQAWFLLDDAERRLDALNFGDMLQMGHVLNRWINRPMVPFPEELPAKQTDYYRPFLFQAKGEDQANDLADIQAMRMYEGYGAHLLFERVIETVLPDIEKARRRVTAIGEAAPDASARARWDLLDRRLEAVICLLRSANNMVAYQALLDLVKSSGAKPQANPVLGTQNDWERSALIDTARAEIDNSAQLMRLLQESKEPILDLAPTPQEETVMRLGPGITAQLQRKIDIMNAHWSDYDRLLTAPNP